MSSAVSAVETQPVRTEGDTLATMLRRAFASHHGPALRHKVDGSWTDLDYRELDTVTGEIARGLIALGVRPGDRVAILANTRAEWTIADLGILRAAAVVVPIYQTSSPDEAGYVLRHSGASVVLCEDSAQVEKVERVRSDCPEVRHVIRLCGEAGGDMSVAELRALGQEIAPEAVDTAAAGVAPGDVATLVYTSGTTGPPKGCMLTHANCLATVAMYEERLDLGGGPFLVYMFLPLAHRWRA